MGKKRNLSEGYHPSDTFSGCTTLMKQWKHNVVPGLNVIDDNHDDPDDHDDQPPNEADTLRNISKLYKTPFVRFGKPLPCLSAAYRRLTSDVHTDPALALVRSRYLWRRKKKRLQELLLSNRRSREIAAALRDVKHLREWKKLPYGIVKLTNHLSNNPDVYFKGVYNWYQGNSLACTVYNDENYLFYAGGPELDRLQIANFDHHLRTVSVPVVIPKSTQLVLDGPIYDVVSYDDFSVIGLRTRNKCTFVLYDVDEAANIILQHCVTVKRNASPFVSVDVVCNQFCTVDADGEVNFWNPMKHNAVRTVTLPKTESFLANKFARVRYDAYSAQRNCFIADRRTVHIFDQRERSFNSHMQWKCDGGDSFVEQCEDISVLLPSLTENYWYIGLNHACMLLDVRKGFVQKWVHMLPQTPALGHSFQINKQSHDTKEAVVLSTQSTNDMVAIYEKWSSQRPESTCFPVSLPSRIDTMHECRMNGLLCDNSLSNVFDFSTIGLSAYRRKNKMGIFSLVSTGDIFHHQVKRTSSCGEENIAPSFTENDFRHIEHWQRDLMDCRKKYDRSITATSIIDMSKLISELRSNNEQTRAWSKGEHFNKSAVRKISKKSLNSYTDYLAPRLIEGFEFDEEPPDWQSDMKNRTINDWLAEVASSPESLHLDENYSDTDGGNATAENNTNKSKSVAGVTANSPVRIDDNLSQELFTPLTDATAPPLNDGHNDNDDIMAQMRDDEMTDGSSDASFSIKINAN